jgi:hypothetical protein
MRGPILVRVLDEVEGRRGHLVDAPSRAGSRSRRR